MTGVATHSPLGGSGASRWMLCPGSVGLSIGHEDPESDHAKLGTAAHAVNEVCMKTNADAWQQVGVKLGETGEGEGEPIVVDKAMADACQLWLDTIRTWHPDRNQGNSWVERNFHCPSIHEYFYGTADFVYLDEAEKTLHVWDYKHGAGIVVEVKDNPQVKYYGCGALEDLDLWEKVEFVVFHIVQPRGFHFDGPVRQWTCRTSDLVAWLEDELIPAMDRALVSRDTKSGEHCRFCPARFAACPQLMKDMEEFEAMLKQIDKKGADPLTNEQIARLLQLSALSKTVVKAAEQNAFGRLMAGQEIPGFKLANKRSNREWKEGAEGALKKQFGKKAFTEPSLKSPAQIEALPGGEAMATRYAFKPDVGLTVVPAKDGRPAVNKNVKSMFTDQKKGGKK